MIILGIDTTTKWTCAAVSENGQVIAHAEQMLGKKQSEALPEVVDNVLRAADKTLCGINYICTATGPGYYTGIRTGTAYAAALAKAAGKRVIQVSTLETLAFDFCKNDGIYAPMLKARGDAVYAAVYRTENGNTMVLIEPCFIEAADLALQLNELSAAVLIGSDVHLYEQLTALANVKAEREYAPDGVIALIGEKYVQAAVSPEEVRGNYLREPDIGPSKGK